MKDSQPEGRADRILSDPLTFYQSSPLPCPYIPGRWERRLLVEMSDELVGKGLFDRLTEAGFRRSHGYVYRPACTRCQACVPVRIAVERFVARRTLRRVRTANSDLSVTIAPARATREQYTVFQAYQTLRHDDSDMATMTFRDYRSMIETGTAATFVAEARDQSGNLVAACLFDRVGDGLSAVYSFFDATQESRSLGSFLVLWLVERARAEGRRHVYLGYWIAECRKMAYKTRFKPIEALTETGWVALEER